MTESALELVMSEQYSVATPCPTGYDHLRSLSRTVPSYVVSSDGLR